jgi:lysophospholipase L1-like esterase
MSNKKQLEFDCIAGSQVRDTQGEMLDVAGADISHLEQGLGLWNDNHGAGYFNTLGRITSAKKIFKAEDCENDRQRYYWEKVKSPYIYARGYMFDDDHPNAKAAAAILRNIHNTDSPLKLKASVEGGVIARGINDSSLLARTKITKVAITFTPANNATLVEPLNLDKSSTWEQDKILIKSVMHLAKTDIPSFRHITRYASAEKIVNNFNKIRSIAKEAGLKTQLAEYTTDTLIREAVLEKVAGNIKKINYLINTYSEDLTKISKKQLNQMLPSNPEVTDWISKNLKRDDLATWFAREYKKDPGIFNDKNKEDLAHHASIADIFKSNLRLDKNHDFKSGMDALKKDGDDLSKKHADNSSLVEPSGKKFLDLGNGKAWYSLGKGSCSEEAKVMGHCGNEPSEVKGDDILSLRQEHKAPNGKILHKPTTTVISNDGYLGESKGKANTKPQDKEAMTALLKDPRIKGNMGGGYASSHNFGFNDLDPKDQKELAHKHHTLFNSLELAPQDLFNNPRFGKNAKLHNETSKLLKLMSGNSDVTNEEILNAHANKSPELVAGLLQHSKTPNHMIEPLYNHYKSVGNSADELVSSSHLHPLVHGMALNDKHPSVRTAAVRSPRFKPEHMDKAFNDEDPSVRAVAVGSPHFKPEHMDKALNDKSSSVRQAAVKSPHFKPEHTDKAFNDEDSDVRRAAVRSPHFKPEHMDKALNDEHPSVRAAVVDSSHFKPEHMDRAFNDENLNVRLAAVNSSHFKPEHMDKALNDKSSSVRRAAVRSSHFKPEHVDKALNDEDSSVREAAVRSSHFKPEHIDRALNDENLNVRLFAVNSPSFKLEHMDRALNDEDSSVRLAAANSSHLKPEHIDRALNDENPSVRLAAVRSPHFKPQHMDKALNDEGPYVRRAAVESPHFKPEHMDRAFNDENLNVRLAAVNSSHFKPEHMDKALNDKSSSVRQAAVKSPHFKPEHTDKALNDEDSSVREAAVESAAFKEQNIKKTISSNIENNLKKINDLIKGRIIPGTTEDVFPKTLGAMKLDGDDVATMRHHQQLHQAAALKDNTKAGRLYHQGQIKEIDDHISKLNKALTAGYGGAGAPGSLTGGSVIQTEALDDGRDLKYITCNNCGKEGVYMKHQVRCRSCNQHYPMSTLYGVMVKNN